MRAKNTIHFLSNAPEQRKKKENSLKTSHTCFSCTSDSSRYISKHTSAKLRREIQIWGIQYLCSSCSGFSIVWYVRHISTWKRKSGAGDRFDCFSLLKGGPTPKIIIICGIHRLGFHVDWSMDPSPSGIVFCRRGVWWTRKNRPILLNTWGSPPWSGDENSTQITASLVCLDEILLQELEHVTMQGPARR